MKGKTKHIKNLIGSLTMILLLMLSSDHVFAQCGIYFKTKHRAVNKGVVLGENGMRMNDWTGDGKSDFWIFKHNSNGTAVNLIVYPSKATGYWDWDNPIVYATDFPPSTDFRQPAIVKDFNSDQKADILITNRIYKNNGSGSLIAQTNLAEQIEYKLVDMADINNDGLLDWINFSDNYGQPTTIGYRLGNADGTFGQRVAISGVITVTDGGKSTGDFNGDGKIDIAYSTNTGYGILLNAGNGTFTAGALTTDNHSHYFSGIGTYSPQNKRLENVGDFNNDGRDDILTRNQASDKLFILYGQSNGTFSETELPLSGTGAGIYKAVELNGDNNLDIVTFKTNNYTVYLNNGAGGFSQTDYRRSLISFTGEIKVEDFSGDNKADFFDAGTWYEYMPLNVFGEPVTYVQENVCQPTGETKRLNFDGNYYSDLVLWNSSNGVFTSLDHGVFTGGTRTSYSLGSSSAGDVPAPGDFDGDGKTDAAVYRNNTGNWDVKRSSDNAQVTTRWGLPGDIPVPNDYDGGGKTDIAIWRPSDGGWWVLSTETQQIFAVQFGLSGDRPVPADYDGDGKTDIAVYRPSEGVWYYIRSSDAVVVILRWGIATDKAIPADYDGDGKADPTVYRDGDWYILRSSTNSFGFVHWGTATDIPVPRHWNDSLVGITIYRPSTGYWYQSIRHPEYIGFSQQGGTPVYAGLPNN